MINAAGDTRFRFRDLNFKLIFLTLALSTAGVLLVHSATAKEVSQSLVSTTVKQITGIFGGIIVMLILASVDYRKLTGYAWVFYALAVLLLVYVLVFTTAISGAKRWIHIKLLGTIQPSEFAKPALILFLAFTATKIGDRISKPYMLLLYLFASAPVLLLVYKEPDLSTTIVLLSIVAVSVFITGISYRWVIGVLLAVIPFAALFLVFVYQPDQTVLSQILEPHQMERINAYFFPELYPNQVYQQNNSVMAIGSGGLFGKGLNNDSLLSVKNGHFLSEESCDFIFAVIGEELGFAGGVLLLLLLLLLVVECFKIAAKARDTAGKIIAGTSGAMIALQSCINVGVATLLIPNTGLPLPFLSAGLSSLLSSYILIGMVLSVGVYGKRKSRVFR